MNKLISIYEARKAVIGSDVFKGVVDKVNQAILSRSSKGFTKATIDIRNSEREVSRVIIEILRADGYVADLYVLKQKYGTDDYSIEVSWAFK